MKPYSKVAKTYALLMVSWNRREVQHHAPVNFYDWTHKAKLKYLDKRWPGWTWCGNGNPCEPRTLHN